MMKIGRKMLGLIIAVSMICALLPLYAAAAPVTDGHYIKLEELDYSNREAGFSQNNSVAAMSGGKVRVNWAATYGELDFTVNISSAGQYTIWVYGGDSSNTYVSPSKLILDNTTDLNWEAIQGSVQESGMSFKTAYHKVTASLTAGTHTIKYILTGPRPADTTYAGAFDFMMIMPSGYEWTPAKDTFPAPPAYKSFTEGGYAWLEELDYSNREAGFSQNNSVESMSGGKVRVNWAATYGELDFTVNIPATGEYIIWVYGGESGTTYVSPSKLILDGTTDLNWEVIQGGTQEPGMSLRTAYHKVTANLTAGIHTIKYILTGPRPADSTYAGAFDFMVIMPSNYTWTPSKTTVPTLVSLYHDDEYTWLEELNYSNREAGFGQNNSVEAMSGGKVRVHWGASYGELDFTVNISKTGEYTIWVHGGDITNSSVSPAKFVIDGTTDLSIDNVQSEYQQTGMSFQTAYQSANVTLTAGEHTIKYILTDHRPADGNYAGALDFMAIVPARAPFTPVSNSAESTKLDYYMSMLLLDCDLSSITEDITLLDALVDDTAVTWSSDNTSVIANDGTVTRPLGRDVAVTLTATAGGYSKEFAVTVEGVPEYEVTSFDIGGSINAGGTATATVTVKRNGNLTGTANLILAVYTEDGDMIGVDIDEEMISSTPKTFNCSVEIDANQTGPLHANAFIWTDFSELKPIANGISSN